MMDLRRHSASSGRAKLSASSRRRLLTSSTQSSPSHPWPASICYTLVSDTPEHQLDLVPSTYLVLAVLEVLGGLLALLLLTGLTDTWCQLLSEHVLSLNASELVLAGATTSLAMGSTHVLGVLLLLLLFGFLLSVLRLLYGLFLRLGLGNSLLSLLLLSLLH